MTTHLVPSPHLAFAPPLVLGYSLVLSPTSHSSWTEMFQCHKDALDFLLKPGDYRSWGVLEFDNQPGYSDERPRTLRYYNPEDHFLHPVKRRNAASVNSLQFTKGGTRNWFVQGLTIRAPSVGPGTNEDPANITVDLCVIENFSRYGFRIRNTTNCTIQRCVIRESQAGASDSSGIQVKSQGNRDLLGIKILDNEIYNVGDCIQITDNPDDPWLPIEVAIEGNDLYLEENRYIDGTNTTLDENAIDLKAGSDRLDSTCIRNNRMWGMRRSARPDSSSEGELLVIQRFCRNVIIEDNILGDAPRGMKDEVWQDDPRVGRWDDRNIVLRNNEFYAIRDYATTDEGAISKPITSRLRFLNNHFARSRFVLDVPPSQYGNPPPEFAGNFRVFVDEVHRLPSQGPLASPLLQFDSALNPSVSAPFGFEYYQRKRWTGPEVAAGAKPRTAPWWHRLVHPSEWPLAARRLIERQARASLRGGHLYEDHTDLFTQPG